MIRRDFLKAAGIVSAAIAAPSTIVKATESKPDIKDLSTTILRGRVSSAGKGIARVAVTDGINVVQTSENGSYELLSNKTARFVYLSLPSGYEFPQENSLTKFFRAIDHSTSSFIANFELKKLAVSDTKHAFVVWADTQIQNEKDSALLLSESAPDLKTLVDSYGRGFPFHGIGCGDLVWDRFNLLPDYKKAIAFSGIPFFSVIGNHDMDTEARTDEGSSDTFKQHFGPTYYSYNRGRVHYIVLDDVFFIGVSKRYMGYITEAQLSWLEQDLKLVPAGSTIVVSLHIPTNTGQARRDQDKEPELGGTVVNRQHLYALLKPYTVHFMSGHTHFNEVWINENMTEHNHGTVCGAWWTGPICGDGTPGGYGVYEVDGDKLSWYYKSTGKPRTHQMRIYPVGRHKDYPEEICLNLWNYDKNWKVEWFEDGKLMGAPERRTAYDPWAYDLYLGKEKPTPRAFVEPYRTDHVFFIKPQSDAKVITVKATDPFGITYTESLAVG